MTSRAPEPRRHTVAALCAHKLLDAAVAAGLDPARLPPTLARDAEGDSFEARISYESHLALWEALMRKLDDPGFPVFVGERTQPRDYDVVGFAYMTRANLREALDQAIRYGSVWGDGSSWDLAHGERTLTLTLHVEGPARLGAPRAMKIVNIGPSRRQKALRSHQRPDDVGLTPCSSRLSSTITFSEKG